MLNGMLFLSSTGAGVVGVNRPILDVRDVMQARYGIHFTEMPARGSLKASLLYSWMFMTRGLSDYDFLFFNGLGALRSICTKIGCLHRLLLKASGLPIVVYWHESDWTIRALRGEASGKVEALSRLFQTCTVHHLAVSDLTAQAVEQHFGITDIEVVENCVAIPKAYAEPAAVPPDAEPTVINIASIQPRKGPDLFVDVAIRVCRARPDVQFVWLGGGDEYGEWRQRISESGLASRILFPGVSDDPFPWLRQSRLLFLSSREDPCPLVVSEAMAMGRTVITFDNGGAAKVVGEAGVVVPNGDVEQAARAILDMLADPGCSEVNRAAVTIYQNGFTPEAFAARLAPCLHDACAHPRLRY